ncbi:MAG: hypothetical protein HRU79_08715 [Ignavibacteria bacterium]|nr:MAG: hypothetical protein HRU79_08715 [Ignavibacteria bacterium]
MVLSGSLMISGKAGDVSEETRVRRLMKQNGMPVQCKNTWKCMATTNLSETYHPSSDLVQRAFHRTELDELWLSDYSELPAIGPKIYAVAIKDQASHRILGIHVSHDLHVGALFKAFHQAVIARRLKHRTLELRHHLPLRPRRAGTTHMHSKMSSRSTASLVAWAHQATAMTMLRWNRFGPR